MNSDTEFAREKIHLTVDRLIFQQTGKHLSDIEIVILQGAWENKTYEDIAEAQGYTSSYLSKDVGNKLWVNLSAALQEKVSKKNFRAAITRKQQQEVKTNHLSIVVPPQKSSIDFSRSNNLVFPEGVVALDSPFYIERSQVESVCYETILKPGSLIRIKAAKWMGKTSLIYKILTQRSPEQKTIYLDLSSIERSILRDLDKLLRWICVMVSRQLELENRVKDYWDTDILGSNDNCTVYFEEYLLRETVGEVIFSLDNVDRLFAYKEVIEDFLGMLRSWHEKGKIDPNWAKMKLIVAHSTEVYIPLDINQSPFNTGVPIFLKEFNADQVTILANVHQLDWSQSQVVQLMELVGGHPYLVRLAMYQIKLRGISFAQFTSETISGTGIYSDPLRRLHNVLSQSAQLSSAYSKVVQSEIPVTLNSKEIYQLHSLGLVKYQQNLVIPRCKLYREYFKQIFTT